MAINPSTNSSMAGRITPADSSYPYGSAQDETAAGANDGTPYFKARADDVFGLQQALLRASGITPSGNAETALISQYLQCIVEEAAGRASFVVETGTSVQNAYEVSNVGTNEACASYYDGMTLMFRPSATNTLEEITIDAFNLGARGIKNKKGGGLYPGQLSTVLLNVIQYDAVADVFRFREIDFDREFGESLIGALKDVTDSAAAGQVLKKQIDGTWAPEDDTAEGVSSTSFMTATDTPASYATWAGALVNVNDDETGLEFSNQAFTAGDLSSVVFPSVSLIQGALRAERNNGVVFPIGFTGAGTQNKFEIPLYGLPSGTRVKFSLGVLTSTDLETETPFSLTVFIRNNDGSTISSGVTIELIKVDSENWTATAEYLLLGVERAIEFFFIVGVAALSRTSLGSMIYASSRFDILSIADGSTGSERTAAYRENVLTNLNLRLHNAKINQTASDGSREFSSVKTAVDALGSGVNINLPNEALIYPGEYLNEVSEGVDIDPPNFCNIIHRGIEDQVVIDGRQAPGTANQSLIQTLFLKNSAHLKGLTFLAENSRYPCHLESGGSNARAQQLLEDITAIHYGADGWGSPTAFGVGHHDGQHQTLRRVTGQSYEGGALGWHDSADWILGCEIVVEDSHFWTNADTNITLACSSFGSGVRSVAKFRNCSINGSMVVNNDGWLSERMENQPANRWGYKLIFDNCSPFDWFAPNDSAAALILQSLNNVNSDIVISGDAVPVLFGAIPDIRKGGLGLPAKVLSQHAITTDGVDPGVTLSARLGDRSGGAALTLTVAFDGGPAVNVLINQDYTGLTNSAVIAALQSALDTAEGGASGRVFAENFGEWRNNAPVFQPSREGVATNEDTTAILKGHALARDGNRVVLMTDAMPASRFAGIALNSAVVGDPVRFLCSGRINEVMLTGLVGAPVLYDTVEVGTSPGELVIGTSEPLLRVRSLQTFGDTFEFIGREN